jgi:lysylphosphatidylglycerol synthetase-like protein (DUF2156 family)
LRSPLSNLALVLNLVLVLVLTLVLALVLALNLNLALVLNLVLVLPCSSSPSFSPATSSTHPPAAPSRALG